MPPSNLPTGEGDAQFNEWNPMMSEPEEARHISDFTKDGASFSSDEPSAPVAGMPEEPMQPMQTDRRQGAKDVALKSLAVVGLVAVLGLVGWGGINVAKMTPGAMRAIAGAFAGVSSVFIPAERIVITANDDLVSTGRQITIVWEHRGKDDDGSYSLSYECRPGLHFELTDSAGRDSIVFCNTNLSILDTDTSLRLTPISTSERVLEVPLSINFVQNGSSRISESGTFDLTVANPTIQEDGITLDSSTDEADDDDSGDSDDGDDDSTGDSGNGSTDGPTTPPNPAGNPGDSEDELTLFDERSGPSPSDPNGQPDLKVTIIDTGVVSRIDNSFTASSTIDARARAGIKFEVINLGTKETGGWRFTAVLPSNPRHIYNSKNQINLLPGDRIEFTLGFDAIKDIGPNEIVINIDPNNAVKNEVTKSNNIVKATIIVAAPN